MSASVDRRVDRVLGVGEELVGGGAECGVLVIGRVDPLAQRLEHGRQVRLELLHRLAEFGDLLPLVAEEQVEQLQQRRRVRHVGCHHRLAVLVEDCALGILEDDVVLRIAAPELLLDLLLELVVGVLGFPMAERHANVVKHRAVGIDGGLLRGQMRIFFEEDQLLRRCPVIQKSPEGRADHLLVGYSGELPQPVDLVEILLDQ